jgi:hypothetical protein
VSRNSSVSIFIDWTVRVRIPVEARPALRPTQPGVKRQGREADHSPPSNAQDKNGGQHYLYYVWDTAPCSPLKVKQRLLLASCWFLAWRKVPPKRLLTLTDYAALYPGRYDRCEDLKFYIRHCLVSLTVREQQGAEAREKELQEHGENCILRGFMIYTLNIRIMKARRMGWRGI